MDIRFFSSTWGTDQPTLEDSLRKIKRAGFDGVELGVPDRLDQCPPVRKLLDELGLLLIVQQWTRGATPEEHAASFVSQYERAVSLRPLGVNSHTGKDYFSLDQNLALFNRAAELERAAGVPVWHETHRGRALFSTLSTRAVLAALPDVKLTADFSHWCCVHESLLEDQPDAVARAIDRSFHIHARVGYSQGPQVPDPRAPEWLAAAQAHLTWWRAIARTRREAGTKTLTICSEFGPPPYMTIHPATGLPLVDLWLVNCYMRDWLARQSL
jgi:hypothetical protein